MRTPKSKPTSSFEPKECCGPRAALEGPGQVHRNMLVLLSFFLLVVSRYICLRSQKCLTMICLFAMTQNINPPSTYRFLLIGSLCWFGVFGPLVRHMWGYSANFSTVVSCCCLVDLPGSFTYPFPGSATDHVM